VFLFRTAVLFGIVPVCVEVVRFITAEAEGIFGLETAGFFAFAMFEPNLN